MYTDDLVKYIVGEVDIIVPFMGYKYYFGKYYRNHPRFIGEAAKTLYMNEYDKIYNITGVLEQLRLIYPLYHIFYDDINGAIHVRVIA